MTLNDYMLTLDSNQIVAIGTSGSGFVYIGEVWDINAISKRFKSYNKNAQSNIKYKYALLKHLFENPPELTGEPNIDFDVIAKRCELMAETNWKLGMERDYIERYIPVFDREVLETYDRVVDDALVIIIEGSERGNYWTLDEYRAVYPNAEG